MSSFEQAHLRVWLYRRTAPGEFVAIPIKTWDRWTYGKAALPPSDDGYVWYVTLTVSMLNRKVVEVGAFNFAKARVNSVGLHTEKMRRDDMVLALNTAWPLDETDPSGAVVDASNRFALRRLRWKPTAAYLRALHDLVNRRAGRQVMP